MKKNLILNKVFIVCLVIFSVFINNSFKAEASGPTISIGSKAVLQGEDISIPVSISGAIDVKKIIFTFIYNGSLLTYTGYTSNYASPLGTGTTTIVTGSGGTGLKITPTWISDSPINGDFTPITLNFHVKSPITATLPSDLIFGGALQGYNGNYIYNSSDVDIKSTYTFETGTISATPVTLSSIAITHAANKLSYYVGESLDIGGLEITGTYNDSSTKVETITNSDVSGFDSSTPIAGQTLTVTVGSQSITYNVDIVSTPVTLSSVEITHVANKLSYYVGETLDITGLEVTGTYSDTTTQIQTISTVDVSGFNSSSATTGQILTITIDGKTITYVVDIKSRPTISIGSSSVFAGDTINIPINITNAVDINKIIVNVLYNGELLTYNSFSSNYPTTGTTTVSSPVIAGQGMKTTITWISAASINGEFTPVNLNFTVKSPMTVVLPSAITFGGISGNSIQDSTNTEIKSISVFNNGTISATPVTLSSIAITHAANKLSYYVGESLDIGGLEITGTYNDSSTKVETITNSDVSGFDSSTPITGQTLTVTVGSQSITYNVSIRRRSSSGGGGGGSISTTTNRAITTPVVITQAPFTNNNQPTVNNASNKIIIYSKILKVGSKNEDVKMLQLYLNTLKYNCGIPDGVFGPKTKAAVISFQKANGLIGDGIVGPKTINMLK